MKNTVLVLVLSLCLTSAFGKVIYVDSSASAGGDGTQANPYKDIASASTASTSGDQISIASGAYSVSQILTKLNIDFYAPNGATVTCDSLADYGFTAYDGVSFRNIVFQICNGPFVQAPNGTVAFQNCQFSNITASTTASAINVGSKGKINVDSCTFSDNGVTAILVASAGIANVTNSRFFRNVPVNTGHYGGVTVQSTGSLIANSNIFSQNGGAITATSGTLNLVSNNFYSNAKNAASNYTVSCVSTTVTQSGNKFCGYLGASVSCTGLTAVYSYADSCGICNGANSNKDCNGVCFGTVTGTCPSRKTYWVSPTGAGSIDGSSKLNAFSTIQAGINAASYADTVMLVEGAYSGSGNYNLNLNKKAITVTSEYGQPERTTITCSQPLVDTGINIKSGESFDTVIKGITITSCNIGIDSQYSSPTLQSLILTSNTQTAVNLLSSSPKIIDCDFNNNGGSGFSQSTIYSTATAQYYGEPHVTYSRFKGNAETTGEIYVKQQSAFYLDSCFFIQNTLVSATAGVNIYADPNSILSVTNTSMYTNITAGSVVFCNAATNLVQSANKFCGVNGNNLACTPWTTPTNLSPDTCGSCGGTNTNMDCNNTCFGRSVTDTQGGCCLYFQKDCNLICHGPSVVDSFSTCCVPPKTIDCTGRCGGTFVNDRFNVCCNASSVDSTNTCCTSGTIDCNGICNGNWTEDTKGACCPASWKDYCGVCNGTNNSCQTCTKSCLNGGTCNNTIQSCSCVGGYYGEQCEIFSCPAGCHGGNCVAPNLCNCNGTSGTPPNCLVSTNCGNVTCYNNGSCAGQNACDCTYANNYTGSVCTEFTCTSDCKHSGVCVGPDLCDCSASNGFFGNFCDQFTCPTTCKNGGTCTGPNTCSCLQGWGGADCGTDIGALSNAVFIGFSVVLIAVLNFLLL